MCPTRPWAPAALLVLVIAVAVGLRGYRLAERSLWFDEGFTWRLLQFPLPEMLERIGRDNHPPLYFLLLKGWTVVLGDSVLALRSLSVVLGGLTVLGMYLFTAEAFRTPDGTRGRAHWLALMAAALTATSVFQVRWGWEARMYTLGTAAVAFSSWALFRALHAERRSVRPWLLYAAITLLFLYTHYYALFSVAAQVLFLLSWWAVRCRLRPGRLLREPSFRGALLAAAVLSVGYLPWLPIFLKQRQQVQADFWTTYPTGWDLAQVCYEMFVEPENADRLAGPGLTAAALCGLCLLGLLWRPRAGEWYLLCAAAAPVACGVLVSFLDTKVFHLRYCLFAHLFLLAAVAALAFRIRFPCERGLLCAVLLGNALWFCIAFWERLNVPAKPGCRAALEWVAARRQSGEPVIVSSSLQFFSALYYCPERSSCFLYDNGEEVSHYSGGPALQPTDFISREQLGSLRQGHVCIVGMEHGYWGRHLAPVPQDWVLVEEASFPEVYRVQGTLVVRRYEVFPPIK